MLTKLTSIFHIVALAMANTDFVVGALMLRFEAGPIDGTVQCANITIIDDMALEGDETFSAFLTVTSDIGTLGKSVTEITITDNDGKRSNQNLLLF